MATDQQKRLQELMDGIDPDELTWIEQKMLEFESYYDPEWLAEQRGTQPFSIKEMIKQEIKRRKNS